MSRIHPITYFMLGGVGRPGGEDSDFAPIYSYVVATQGVSSWVGPTPSPTAARYDVARNLLWIDGVTSPASNATPDTYSIDDGGFGGPAQSIQGYGMVWPTGPVLADNPITLVFVYTSTSGRPCVAYHDGTDWVVVDMYATYSWNDVYMYQCGHRVFVINTGGQPREVTAAGIGPAESVLGFNGLAYIGVQGLSGSGFGNIAAIEFEYTYYGSFVRDSDADTTQNWTGGVGGYDPAATQVIAMCPDYEGEAMVFYASGGPSYIYKATKNSGAWSWTLLYGTAKGSVFSGAAFNIYITPGPVRVPCLAWTSSWGGKENNRSVYFQAVETYDNAEPVLTPITYDAPYYPTYLSAFEENGYVFLAVVVAVQNSSAAPRVDVYTIGTNKTATLISSDAYPGHYVPAEQNISVDARTTSGGGNVTLSGVQVVDGFTTGDNNRIMVANQSDTTQNGIYDTSSSGVWTRSSDSNTWIEVARSFITVYGGDTQMFTSWHCTSGTSGTLGSTAVTYASSWKPESAVTGNLGPVKIVALVNWRPGYITGLLGG